MTTQAETYASNYDPSIFYTSMRKKSNTPSKPIHGLVKYTIKLTVTLKDIGLEGLDSSSPDKALKILKRELKKKGKSKKSNDNSTFLPQLPAEPPTRSPRIKRLIEDAEVVEPIYEGTFYKNRIQKSTNINSSNDPKPIGLLSSNQKGQKPQTVIPKASPRGSPRLSYKERSVPVPEGDIPFEEQIKRDNENRYVDISQAPVPVPEGDIPFEEQIRHDNENRYVDIK